MGPLGRVAVGSVGRDKGCAGGRGQTAARVRGKKGCLAEKNIAAFQDVF